MGAIDEGKINDNVEHQRVMQAMKRLDDQKTQEFLNAANMRSQNSIHTRELTQILQIILCQQDLIHVFYHDRDNPLEFYLFRTWGLSVLFLV